MATKKPVVIETTLADLWSQFQTGDTLDVNGALTVNDAGGDFDTRIEGDTATNLFVTDAGLDAVLIGTTVAGQIADFRATNVVINENGGDIDFRTEGDTATNLFLTDASLDAVQIGTTVAGAIMDARSTAIVFNEPGADFDTRIEGDTLTHFLYMEGDASTENICLLGAAAPNWQSMDRGLFIGNMTTAPTGNPTSGVFAWVDGDTFKIQNPSGTVKDLFASGGSGSQAPDIQAFDTTGANTWTKPAGAVTVDVHLIGGGGGGGSGRRGASGSERGGGAGGGGGGYSFATFSEATLGATETVTVGAGGAGGSHQASNSTNGNAGSAGSSTTFGAHLTAGGGGGGGGGTNAGSAAAGGSGGSNSGGESGGAGGNGAFSSTTAGAGGSTTGFMAGAGGGGGSGINSSNLVTNSEAGGLSAGIRGPRGVTLTNDCLNGGDGGVGASFIAGTDVKQFGGGGGGGGGSFFGSVQNSPGGTGAKFGGGGGGGGALTDSVANAFNAGRAGGQGLAVVITYFA